jgi:peptidoglycan hydrolase-like protein with peptidoglycan-binding domain
MKKLSIVLMGVFICLVLVRSTRAATIFTVNLQYGVKNSAAVRDLQQFLKNQGDFTADVTGNFFTVTQAAVKQFQKEQDIKITGVFDKTTRDKANELLAAQGEVDTGVTPDVINASSFPQLPPVTFIPSQHLPSVEKKAYCIQQVNTQFPNAANASPIVVSAETDLTNKKSDYQDCLSKSGTSACQTNLQQVLNQASIVNQLVQAPSSDKVGVTMADYQRTLARCNGF